MGSPSGGWTIDRRSLLWMLGSACIHRPQLAATPAPTGAPIRLGWRWIPGMRLTYRTTVRRRQGRVTTSRVEVWRYTARELTPQGHVLLSGRLKGFGASVAIDGIPLPEHTMRDARAAAQAATHPQVELVLALTGKVLSCTQTSFQGALPHRMLGLHLPPDAVLQGESWSDPSVTMPYTQAIPHDARIETGATTTLSGVTAAERGWHASLSHTGTIRTQPDGPMVHIQGATTWETSPGALLTRFVQADLLPDNRLGQPLAGTLSITMKREPAESA